MKPTPELDRVLWRYYSKLDDEQRRWFIVGALYSQPPDTIAALLAAWMARAGSEDWAVFQDRLEFRLAERRRAAAS
jgi:hypothetical protein